MYIYVYFIIYFIYFSTIPVVCHATPAPALPRQDTLSSSTAATAAAAVAVRQVVPTAMEDVTAAAAMVTVQQMRTSRHR